MCLFLGAAEVGKTSIVQQFVNSNLLSDLMESTTYCDSYYPSVIVNGKLYEVRLIDCPVISFFPATSLSEWSHFKGYCLRQADCYILVYDLTRQDTLQHIKKLKEQIFRSRNMHDVPVFVVGNKHDLKQDEERTKDKREMQNVIKKQWKCAAYIECSALYNWHVVTLFHDVMKAIDKIDHEHKSTSVRVQEAFRRNRCVILW